MNLIETKMESHKKALEILEKINNSPITKSDWESCSEYARKDLSRKGLIVVNYIESALTEYGNISMELQNMDSEFRYWYKVMYYIVNPKFD